MRRGEILSGILLLLLGGLFFLKASGYPIGNVFSWFWPLFIVAGGVWVLLDGLSSHGATRHGDLFSVALEGAKEAHLRIECGANQLELGPGAVTGDFITGNAGAAVKYSTFLNGGKLEVLIEAGPSLIPFIGPDGGVWRYRISPAIPTEISIQAGASHLELDFTDLPVTRFSFKGGASSLNLTLPAHAESTLVDMQAGAASIDLRVPEGVAIRFRTRNIGTLKVDEKRFPRQTNEVFQSMDYLSAKHRAEINVDGGTTSINVH